MTHVSARGIPTLLIGLLVWGTDPAAATELPGPGHQACDSCHFSAGGGFGDALPDSTVCLECHTPASMQPAPLAGEAGPGHYRLGASGAGSVDCLTCHDPHAQDSHGRIREVEPLTVLDADLDPASRLCVRCHESQAAFREVVYSRHPVGVPVPGGFRPSANPSSTPLADVAGTDDPTDDVIACTTCHTVHERRERYLLRWRGREGMITGCTGCHDLSGTRGGGDI